MADLIENVQKALNDQKFTCEVFMDLGKLFDTVDHKLLLKDLTHDRIRCTTRTGLD